MGALQGPAPDDSPWGWTSAVLVVPLPGFEPRRKASKARVLPVTLQGNASYVLTAGLEPARLAAPDFKSGASTSSSHVSIALCGASRTRTGDPLLAKQMRYQLRYSPMELSLSDGRKLPAVPWTTRSAADHRRFRQLRGQDSNLRPQGYEPCELPNCSTPLEPTIGHDPMTCRLRGGCSTI